MTNDRHAASPEEAERTYGQMLVKANRLRADRLTDPFQQEFWAFVHAQLTEPPEGTGL